MVRKELNIDELKTYIDGALCDDVDLLSYYDKGEHIETILAACENIYLKIKHNYPDAKLYGIEDSGVPIAYFVGSGTILVSFGMSLGYRTKESLTEFWDNIKQIMGNNFQSIIYSYNDRALGFLKKCGMDIIFDNVTVLQYN